MQASACPEEEWRHTDRESLPGRVLLRESISELPIETVLFTWPTLYSRYWIPHYSTLFPVSHCQPSLYLSLLLQELKMLSIQTPGHMSRTLCYLNIKVLRNANFQKRIDFYGEANHSGSRDDEIKLSRQESLIDRWQKFGMKLRSWGTLII